MTTFQLSADLIKRISKKIKTSKPPTFYWDSHYKLTPQQVNMLLSLTNGIEEVENDIYSQDHYYEGFVETQRDHVFRIVKQFLPEIQKEQDEDREKVSEDNLNELIEEYDFLSNCPGVDTNLQQLTRNSRSSLRIVLQLDLHHKYEGWQWKENIRYEDVKDILKLFNINPKDIHKSFPYHPRRKGKPYIKPKDLIELWDNATHGGQYVIPITLSLNDYMEKRHHYHHGLTLHKGTHLWLHNYACGSGSISVPLRKELKIKKAQISYDFEDDRDTAGYGMDEVYGLNHKAWQNYLSPITCPTPVIKLRGDTWPYTYIINHQKKTSIFPYYPTANNYFLEAERLDLGLTQVGINFLQSLDIDKEAIDCLKANPHYFVHNVLNEDIKKMPVLDPPKTDIMTFSYPCTRYAAVTDIHETTTRDELFLHARRHMTTPIQVFCIENVPEMMTFKFKLKVKIQQFVKWLRPIIQATTQFFNLIKMKK